MRKTFGVLFALALALPAAAQEPGDSAVSVVGTTSAAVPVWVVVEDVEGEVGAHQVRAAVIWEDYRLGFRFSGEVLPGELVVAIPKDEGVVSTETCAYASALMTHGSEGYQPMERADADCLAPSVEHLSWIGAEHRGSPMACKEADRGDGIENPRIRIYGCYWATEPGG
jgi:hypothetical protein